MLRHKLCRLLDSNNSPRRYMTFACVLFLVLTFLATIGSEFLSSFSVCPQPPSPLTANADHQTLPPKPKPRVPAATSFTAHADYQKPTPTVKLEDPKSQPPLCVRGQTQLVILLTYGRSGSTFTADIIVRNPEVWYYFEPLHNLAKSFTNVQREYSAKHGGKYLYLTSIPEYLQQAEDMVETWMTCDYLHQTEMGYNNLHMPHSPGTGKLHQCLSAGNKTTDYVKSCLILHSAFCKRKAIQFLKVIRLPVASVGRLMAKHPHLKMIYLVRDPRGSYLSKKGVFHLSTNTTYEAEKFCLRFYKDVTEALRLHHLFPGRVLITRYESIAADPMTSAQQLYQFLCLKLTPDIADYIRENTMANHGSNNPYSVKRANSSASAYKWRSTLSYDDARAFDVHCQESYHKLGYLPINSKQHLRDTDSPLKTSVDLIT